MIFSTIGITPIIGLLSFFHIGYFTYLFFHHPDEFQEWMLYLSYQTLRTWSYIQIYSIKGYKWFQLHISPQLTSMSVFLLENVKEQLLSFETSTNIPLYSIASVSYHYINESAHLVQPVLISLFSGSDFAEDWSRSKEMNTNTSIPRANHLQFIKDGKEISLHIRSYENKNEMNHLEEEEKEGSSNNAATKVQALNENKLSSELFDFIIYTSYDEADNIQQKIFSHIPEKYSEYEIFNPLPYDLLSCDLITDLDDTPIPISFVRKDYHFWIQGNQFNLSFLSYFLKKYYQISFTEEERCHYQIQMITKSIKILVFPFNGSKAISLTEKGPEVIDVQPRTIKEKDD